MDTKWLEDFVSLAETRSFSRSAQLRHVTQPAFSRRIQSLEAWAGTDLVDRSAYPTRLTAAGQTLYEQALESLQQLHATRALLRGHGPAEHDTLDLAVPHTLAFTFFPLWLSGLRSSLGPIKSRLHASNVHDAVLRLQEGHCDLLMTYHHPAHPIALDAARFEWLALGQEELFPCARADATGQPLHRLEAAATQPVPFLAYASGAYLRRVVDWTLRQVDPAVPLQPIFETDMSESLKAMAIEGHGAAFLPRRAVGRALSDGRLVIAAESALRATLQIRLYRERPASGTGAGAGALKGKALARQVWERVAQQCASAA
ncbi:MAG: LysR substrate-binding domain-containing protein [Serpentinimonas sp.]|nr:MAG: LysR family transcriptional regulator [Comamonadaceae bacterium BICA1-1]MDO9612565.1 LysR substrate-binding domain-containing protein [Serpentinimonas sp.]